MEDRPAADAVPDPALLERVLEETLSDGGVPELDSAELHALTDVARRYRGSARVSEPIALELVKSVLLVRFPGLSASDTLWHDVSRQIATILYESPDTHERLDRLWSQLSELIT